MVCLASIALRSISAALPACSGAHIGSGGGGGAGLASGSDMGEHEVGEQDVGELFGGDGGGILDLHVDRQPCDGDRGGSEGFSWVLLERYILVEGGGGFGRVFGGGDLQGIGSSDRCDGGGGGGWFSVIYSWIISE